VSGHRPIKRGDTSAKIVVVKKWFEELKRLVPAL